LLPGLAAVARLAQANRRRDGMLRRSALEAGDEGARTKSNEAGEGAHALLRRLLRGVENESAFFELHEVSFRAGSVCDGQRLSVAHASGSDHLVPASTNAAASSWAVGWIEWPMEPITCSSIGTPRFGALAALTAARMKAMASSVFTRTSWLPM